MLKEILDVVLVIAFFNDAASLSTIDTIPPTIGDVIATAYPGLIVTTQFDVVNSTCAWSYEGYLEKQTFYSNDSGCLNITKENFTITCIEGSNDGVKYLESNLTLLFPLKSNVNVSVYCNNKQEVVLPYKVVKDCPSILPYNVVVKSQSYTYDSPGTFGCSNNGTLFYSYSRNLRSIDQTTCTVLATWHGQRDLQCWTAPKVTLKGNKPVIDGEILNLTCSYDDVIPVGDRSGFHIGDNVYFEMLKNSTLAVYLHKEDNNKEMYCQALTPYTEIFRDAGKSQIETANVLYRPYQDNSIHCNWEAKEEGLCDVKFHSNPIPEYIALIKDGSVAQNDNANTLWGDNYGNILFRFKKNQVSEDDNGNYTIVMSSSTFPQNQTINFTIHVIPNMVSTFPPPEDTTIIQTTSEKPSNDTTDNTVTALIAVCSVLGALLAAMLAIEIFSRCKSAKGGYAYKN